MSLQCVPIQRRIQVRGVSGRVALRSNFKQFSAKSLPNDRLVPLPLGLAPPLRNPGSATAIQYCVSQKCTRFFPQKKEEKQEQNSTKCSKYFTASMLICT